MVCHVCNGTGVLDQGPVLGPCQKCGGSGSIDATPTPAEVREVLEQAEDALTAALDPDGACPKEIGDAWDAVHALLARLPEDPA